MSLRTGSGTCGPSRDSGPGAGSATPPAEPLRRIPPRRPPGEPGVESAKDLSVFPGRLFDAPRSVFVYGPSPPLVHLTIFALAAATNPDFHWVEFGRSSESRASSDPIRLGWIPNHRLWLIDPPGALRPDDTSASLPLSNVISTDEPPESLRLFTEFLRLPDLSQRILASQVPNERPGVVAVANAERVEETFSEERVAPILSLHRSAGFSVVVGFGNSPGPGRDLFDFVFRLQGADVETDDWKHNQLVCERGISSGPLRDLRPVRLDRIPLLTGVLSKARPSE